MQTRNWIFVLVAAYGLTGCGSRFEGDGSNAEVVYPGELSADEFVSWVKEEQALNAEHHFEDMSFRITYRPAEWMALNNLDEGATANDINMEAKHYEDLMCFTLRIELNNDSGELLKYKLSEQEEYTRRVNYYAFEIQRDIQLFTGKDTLRCGIVHFERTFGIANYSDIMIGFSRKELEETNPGWGRVCVALNDRIFGHGKMIFTFDKKQLTNTPKIKV